MWSKRRQYPIGLSPRTIAACNRSRVPAFARPGIGRMVRGHGWTAVAPCPVPANPRSPVTLPSGRLIDGKRPMPGARKITRGLGGQGEMAALRARRRTRRASCTESSLSMMRRCRYIHGRTPYETMLADFDTLYEQPGEPHSKGGRGLARAPAS